MVKDCLFLCLMEMERHWNGNDKTNDKKNCAKAIFCKIITMKIKYAVITNENLQEKSKHFPSSHWKKNEKLTATTTTTSKQKQPPHLTLKVLFSRPRWAPKPAVAEELSGSA